MDLDVSLIFTLALTRENDTVGTTLLGTNNCPRETQAAPRTRGWTAGLLRDENHLNGDPAEAGMAPC